MDIEFKSDYPYNIYNELTASDWPYEYPSDARATIAYAMESALLPREREIMIMRYMLGMSREDCGRHFSVTRERIRQIEAKSARKIYAKHGAMLKVGMAQYLNDKAEARAKQAREISRKNAIYMAVKAVAALEEPTLEEEGKTAADIMKALDLEIVDLDLSVRTKNCLIRAGIRTAGDLAKLSKEDLMKVRNLGRHSFDEAVAKMRELGICDPKFDEVNNGD